jgi:transcriptional regulator with XRE-family HTH domain
LCYTTRVSPATLLKEARHAAGFTQSQLAERLGTSQPVVSRLERRGANPTWETLVRALAAMGYGVQLAPLDEAAVGLDLNQLRERLALSPAARLRTFQASQESLARLSAGARNSKA